MLNKIEALRTAQQNVVDAREILTLARVKGYSQKRATARLYRALDALATVQSSPEIHEIKRLATLLPNPFTEVGHDVHA